MQQRDINKFMFASSNGSREDEWRYAWLMCALFCGLILLCTQGYGSDSDTYAVLRCGSATWHDHLPCMSRNPGYWTYEAIAHLLSLLGGYLLSNFASLGIAILVVWRFHHLALRLHVRSPLMFAACLLVTPVFAIAATSTMDYLWSLLFIVLTGEMLSRGLYVRASIVAAIAISLRAANSIVVAGGFAAAICYEIFTVRRFTTAALKVAASGIGAALLGSLTYFASYHVAGDSMAFLTPLLSDPAAWTLKMRAGKFLYKTCYAFGPAAMIVLTIGIATHLKRRPRFMPSVNVNEDLKLPTLCSGFLLGNLVLYLMFPIEVSYLIPAIFFSLLLIGRLLSSSRTFGYILFFSILSLDFVLPQFAQPNVPENATAANLHFRLVAGTLLQDVTARRALIGCGDEQCWKERNALPPHQ